MQREDRGDLPNPGPGDGLPSGDTDADRKLPSPLDGTVAAISPAGLRFGT
ncbi:MAG: hypothetical protein H0U79_04825 [Solirubrobacterales bacterium]|nr:hypothetical protein [Solirubrobacterales bacterium]